MKKQLALIATLVAASFALTACDPGSSDPAPTPTAASESPTPTPTTAATKPELGDLVLTTEGLGELKIGLVPPTGDPSTNLVSFDANGCPGQSDPSLWSSTYPNIDDGFGPQAPFSIGVDSTGVINRIDVRTPDIYTDMGLHIGSSLDEVLGVYPGGPDEVVNHADVSDVYVILGTSGKLMFEVAVDRIPDYWDASAINTVVFLSAIDTHIDAYGVAASDNAVGVCNGS
jgi:hypothetical protein